MILRAKMNSGEELSVCVQCSFRGDTPLLPRWIRSRCQESTLVSDVLELLCFLEGVVASAEMYSGEE